MDKRQFVRDRRKDLKLAKRGIYGVQRGCAMNSVYGDYTNPMEMAVCDAKDALGRIDEITKRIAQ